ncbi:hypothetical protein HYH02_002677 [Chlamydomonas schloesseri]|uniref:SRCR domain-containing protein n=1 Tax=Chlamydomonas schloesseri TaxID=2026947 RepID=A0A835WS66_9CHLO|nr:hypothetical protein HYH02_002677 [Chlamydomonas schloesseri]|eukprot:KAG2452434.1 hypothetical protein HYH02_002677 [Chlamydomonas schloesseri]
MPTPSYGDRLPMSVLATTMRPLVWDTEDAAFSGLLKAPGGLGYVLALVKASNGSQMLVPVCDRGWTNDAARVACSLGGFQYGVAVPTGGTTGLGHVQRCRGHDVLKRSAKVAASKPRSISTPEASAFSQAIHQTHTITQAIHQTHTITQAFIQRAQPEPKPKPKPKPKPRGRNCDSQECVFSGAFVMRRCPRQVLQRHGGSGQ